MACSPRFDRVEFANNFFHENDQDVTFVQIIEVNEVENFDNYIFDDDSEQEIDESVNAADELLFFIYENNLTSNRFAILEEE